ncbi:pyridoxamine 5'-phosphate oxidase family protein [Cellulomonas sp. ACRRI]|uniref:pyridoxamine 5'-phosphate oxidase family protein n=1 Tax=Cellulomonas sp. ACRRI TaxID=2918188 RepID=UPI001EF19E0C|nr:pyridoxamine 5'-phosphate oxidase family protein [Cellulomonas sp. ACRRI]MCG7284534.1 pyridoxamine 5'-phosphate oxidase family protein [Cellulomonas sp. ACRRI]
MTTTADAALAPVWDALAAATTRRTPFTLASLATVSADGAPRSRSVILRSWEPGRAALGLATDARSAKVREIRADPRVSLVVWDDDAQVQVRLEGRAAVVDDPAELRRRWEGLGARSRRGYATVGVPGTPVDGDATPARDDDEAVWSARFAWVEVVVDRVDRLDLSSEPHDRVVAERAGAGWRARRVVP